MKLQAAIPTQLTFTTNQIHQKLLLLWSNWGRSATILGLANAALWSVALLSLYKAPATYTSAWSVTLPGGNVGVSFNVPDIGQASSSSSSPFNRTNSDPRADYQYIATSEPVLSAAAASLHMTVKEFGEPRMKLLNNTKIMEMSITGETPEQANEKAMAHYAAMEARLSYLRTSEVQARDRVVQSTLKSATAKLTQAQSKLSDYKARSGFNSSDQVRNLAVNIEVLRKQQAEAIAQQQEQRRRLQALTTQLNLTPPEAVDAFTLQGDQIFQQTLKDYSEATANLVNYRSKLTAIHPSVINETSRQTEASQALRQRAQALLNRPITPNLLQRLTLDTSGNSTARAQLFQDLVSLQAEQQGTTAAVQATNQQLQKLETRLQLLSQKESEFDNLNRDVQINQAIFASTLAKADLIKGDIFSSYPFTQLLESPNITDKPALLKKYLILGGSSLGSLMMTGGLLLLWKRKQLTGKLKPQGNQF